MVVTQADKFIDYLDIIKETVVEAGNFIEEKKRTGYHVVRKEIKEMVTELDLAVQKQLISRLRKKTQCNYFICEEMRGKDSELNNAWIIDPLDGTHNFIAGLPFYSISIGYMERGEILLGVIYFPYSQEMYWVRKGQGAFKNNNRINVSSNTDIAKSIIAYDNQFYRDENSISNFVLLQDKVFTTRILGVASRDACFVAEGILDARIWNATKLCDIAVGGLMVEEAGGRVTDFNGERIDFRTIKDVIVSSGKIHDELIKTLKRGKK